MSKKKRKNKRKKGTKHPVATSKVKEGREEEKQIAAVDVRSDLRKTAILTVVCLGILFLLYLKM